MSDSYVVPLDLNGLTTVIKAADIRRPVRIGLYTAEGVAANGVQNVTRVLEEYPNIMLEHVTSTRVHEGDFSQLDVFVVSGGMSHEQAHGLSKEGEERIRAFVAGGGGYLGICAGAHLASIAHPWCLGIISVRKAVEGEWKRGSGFVDIELADEGREIFGDVPTFKCRYHNGIIMRPGERDDLPAYAVAARFRSEVCENGTTPGAMIDTPAAVYAPYEKGKVFVISAHPEDTPGLEHFVPRAVEWLTKH
jgi:hypothetical protein